MLCNDLGTATIRGVDPSAARVLLTQTPPEICSPTCRVRVKLYVGKSSVYLSVGVGRFRVRGGLGLGFRVKVRVIRYGGYNSS